MAKYFSNLFGVGLTSVWVLNLASGAFNLGILSSSELTGLLIILNGLNIYNAFHEIAQLHVARELSTLGYTPVLEYKIGKKEADIVAGGFVWEIKPITQSGAAQVAEYAAAGGLMLGYALVDITNIPIVDNYYMGVTFGIERGVAHYYFYKFDCDNNPQEVNSTEVNRAVVKKLTWALIAAGALVAATIVEDVFTYGYGVLDDIPSLVGAGALAALILGVSSITTTSAFAYTDVAPIV